MTRFPDLYTYESISHYHSALRDGLVTCVEVTEQYLSRIEEYSHLNAFVTVFRETALIRARELDILHEESGIRGRLFGVIVAIKDVICYKDHPLSASSNILQGFTSIYNSTAVERLLEEGAIIIGSTNCDEFAMGSTNENSAFGPVLNGIRESHVPGGSSGGAAVAVQMHLCMLSLGSDTGGSVRQPADFCGVIGLKPSYGRISRYGLIAYASSFDQIGIFGTSVADIALTLEVISGPDEFDSTASTHPVETFSDLIHSPERARRIGYFREALDSPALDPEIRASILELIDKLKADGYEVQPIEFDLLDYIVPTYYVLTTAEASSNLSRFDGIRFGNRPVDKKSELKNLYKKTRSEGFGKEVKRRIMLGTFVLSAGYYDAYFSRAQRVRQILKDKTDLIFKDFDALILPTAPTPAFKLGENSDDPIAIYLADIFTVYANLVGLPAISLPLFWHSNGLPFGLQVMTNQYCELSLLQLSNKWVHNYGRSGNEKPKPSTPELV